MQKEKTVVEVFGVTYEAFVVEYFDGKEWIGATGPWEGVMNVHPMYSDLDAAKFVAQTLHKVSGNLTRVVKEEESQ